MNKVMLFWSYFTVLLLAKSKRKYKSKKPGLVTNLGAFYLIKHAFLKVNGKIQVYETLLTYTHLGWMICLCILY